ncbi:MAG: 5-deoxy-glucuronate isomerase [Ilumatobacteraceae bacterium]
MDDLLHPAGSLATDRYAVDLSPERAGWEYSGLRVVELPAGGSTTLDTGGFEMVVLPLSGSCTVACEGESFELAGRESVFARVTDFAYVPRGAEVTLTSAAGGDFALCMSRAERKLSPKYGPVDGVQIETRGAGPATRQVNNFLSPEVWDHADRLMCVELLTPDGNWSSYPPHKHDTSPECPVNNEEIYYFRIGRTGTIDYAPEGFGMHRNYVVDGDPGDPYEIDTAVRDGDVFLIPRGYHGPCIAAPGYPMYYLNVLAGPGADRSMAFCDDPAHHWVRDEWEGMATDPRCPMTDAEGVTA